MSARDFKRLTRQIVPNRMSKSDLMLLHLHMVEAMLDRRITPDELRSARFTQSRDNFVKLLMDWKPPRNSREAAETGGESEWR